MAKKSDSSKASSSKNAGKSNEPDAVAQQSTDAEVADVDLEKINESIKAMDKSLGDQDIKKIDDNGNNMPRLVSSDGNDLEQADDDIMDGELEPLSDEITDEVEAEEAAAEQETTPIKNEEQTTEPEQETDKQEQEEPVPEEKAHSPKSKKSDDDGIEDDPELDKAVSDIVAEESDTVLAAEDDSREVAADKPKKRTHRSFGRWFSELWESKHTKKILFGVFLALLAVVAVVPDTRYYALNTIGIRSSVEVRIVDGGTLQPIKNVSVRAGGSDAITNEDGVATLSGVRLGETMLQIDKRAFAPINQPVTIGWGSNPLGEFRVEAVGSQYTFIVKDYLSNQPIARAQASSGDGNATSDENGEFVLTLDTAELADNAEISIQIMADTYRDEELRITVNNREAQQVKMVPSRKHVYVSKRSGTYDVYTSYIDGQDEQLIIEGSGLERDDITLVPHQNGKYAAFVSTRENARNSNGYLLSTLYMLNLEENEITKIDQSEKVQLIGWSKEGRLIYVKIAAGASGTDPKRHRLMSFDSNDFSGFKELAASNSFNDVTMAQNKVYFAPSNIFQEDPNPGLYVINADGQDKQKLIGSESYVIVRTSYDELRVNAGTKWYTYSLITGVTDQSDAPSSQRTRLYFDSPDGKTAAWIDDRDNKGTLVAYNKESGSDSTLTSKSGLTLPMYWLTNDYAVYRVFDGTESADYAINIKGGDPIKIVDVTNTSGIDRWFYY